jgi:predicted metal-binding membrane protein
MTSTGSGHQAASTATTATAPRSVIFAITGTLGLAAAAWILSLRQMNGMAMGVGTVLHSFASFMAAWTVMMAAMMLPGAVPSIAERARTSGAIRAVPAFVAAYLAVWAVAGVVVYALYEPHGTVAAGSVTIAAGLYELTPLKRHFRRRCRAEGRSGFRFGLCCLGSSLGLMAMLVVLGLMSVTWMVVIAVLAVAQKYIPATAVIDVPVALAVIGFGIAIIVAPTAIPGLMPPM